MAGDVVDEGHEVYENQGLFFPALGVGGDALKGITDVLQGGGFVGVGEEVYGLVDGAGGGSVEVVLDEVVGEERFFPPGVHGSDNLANEHCILDSTV